MIFSNLKNPYPAPEPTLRDVYIALGVGLFIGSFLFFFKPFGIAENENESLFIGAISFGLITFFVLFFFYIIIPIIFPKIQEDKNWTLGKELIFTTSMVFTIGVINAFFSAYFYEEFRYDIGFLSIIFNTLVLGSIPVTFTILLDFNQLLKKHIEASQAIDVSKSQKEKRIETTPIPFLNLKTDSDEKTLAPTELLYIEALGNYTNVVSIENEKVNRTLLRSTLTNIEQQIKHKNIIRCHRSFIVNLSHVIDVQGNAQGFKLGLKNNNNIVPVSRKYVPIVKAYFAS